MRAAALDALDRAICLVLGSDQIGRNAKGAVVSGSDSNPLRQATAGIVALESTGSSNSQLGQKSTGSFLPDDFECAVILPLVTLYTSNQDGETRSCALKMLLHLLEVCLFASSG